MLLHRIKKFPQHKISIQKYDCMKVRVCKTFMDESFNGLLAAGSLMTRRDLYWEMMESCFATLDRALSL